MGSMGVMNAVIIAVKMLPTMLLVGSPKIQIGLTIQLAMADAIAIIITITKMNRKVLTHRLLTSLLLLDKLSNAPTFSIMIAGTTRENIIASIIPGMIRAMSPNIISIPEIIATANRERSLRAAELKAFSRFAEPFSITSEAHLTHIPFAIVLTIQDNMIITNAASISTGM